MPENKDGCGHRQRIRDKFWKFGAQGMLDYEILELLLTYAVPRQDVKPLSKKLLAKFKNIAGVMDARPEELCECSGIGQSSAVLIKLARALCVCYLEQSMSSKKYIDSPEHFSNYARMVLGNRMEETVIAFFLNTQNYLIGIEEITSGTVDRVSVFPAEIARHALLYGAKAVVVCHNHPGGLVQPSDNDTAVTLDIRRALKPLGILLLDHIIVSKYNYYSYREAEEGRNAVARILDDPGGV